MLSECRQNCCVQTKLGKLSTMKEPLTLIPSFQLWKITGLNILDILRQKQLGYSPEVTCDWNTLEVEVALALCSPLVPCALAATTLIAAHCVFIVCFYHETEKRKTLPSSAIWKTCLVFSPEEISCYLWRFQPIENKTEFNLFKHTFKYHIVSLIWETNSTKKDLSGWQTWGSVKKIHKWEGNKGAGAKAWGTRSGDLLWRAATPCDECDHCALK